jgi:hypothetical protein
MEHDVGSGASRHLVWVWPIPHDSFSRVALVQHPQPELPLLVVLEGKQVLMLQTTREYTPVKTFSNDVQQRWQQCWWRSWSKLMQI